jgi:hypothetical protein
VGMLKLAARSGDVLQYVERDGDRTCAVCRPAQHMVMAMAMVMGKSRLDADTGTEGCDRMRVYAEAWKMEGGPPPDGCVCEVAWRALTTCTRAGS